MARGDLRAQLAALMGEHAHLDAIARALEGMLRGVSPFAPVAAPDLHSATLLELLWSYWQEEGMLAQSLIAVALRFQDVRRGPRDPLAELATDALRPLSRVLWGFIDDEPNRLGVARRAHEYQHEYGLALRGRAIPPLRPAEARSRFLPAFHTLLRRAAELHAAADPDLLLNALRELHVLLADGPGHQFRDVPWRARSEMLVQQWILSRPEVREFLRGAPTVSYPEPWMGAVDAMRRLQGWGGASVVHFHDLAVLGERLLLTVRHFPWLTASDARLAPAWAHRFRREVRGYVDAYRAVTGVDIAAGPQHDATPPSTLLHRHVAPAPAAG